MPQPTPEELEAITNASYLNTVMPNVEAELVGMQKSVQRRVFATLRDGTLTAQIAEAAWHEMYSIYRLHLRLKKTMSIGQTVGSRVANQMTIGDPHAE